MGDGRQILGPKVGNPPLCLSVCIGMSEMIWSDIWPYFELSCELITAEDKLDCVPEMGFWTRSVQPIESLRNVVF